MASFRCYGNSDVIATLTMTNFHLNTTVVAIFPNAYFWRHSLHSNLVLTLKTNCIKPPSYARTAYVVVIRPSFLSDSFVKIWANCEIFLGKLFTPPPPLEKISRTPMKAAVDVKTFLRPHLRNWSWKQFSWVIIITVVVDDDIHYRVSTCPPSIKMAIERATSVITKCDRTDPEQTFGVNDPSALIQFSWSKP